MKQGATLDLVYLGSDTFLVNSSTGFLEAY